jgi:hypothetical protein
VNTKDIEVDLQHLPWRGHDMNSPIHVWGQGADLLATMYEGQAMLMEKYRDIEAANGCIVIGPAMFGELDDRQVQMRIKDLMWRLTEELGEAANCLKNKPWKNSFIHTDREHFEEEISDAWHFFLELLETCGISPEDLFLLYFKKHAVNEFRQRSNY